THNYYNLTYTPLFDMKGQVFSILDIAIDVTATMSVHQHLTETESQLRGAIELAELATWNINIDTGIVEYSERMREWLGIGASQRAVQIAVDGIPEADRKRVSEALKEALDAD